MRGVSVIICCYNSAKRLPATLQHLAHQEISNPIPWEIIIVNNVSTDNTTYVAYKEWEQYNKTTAHFRVVDELKPGLSFARKRGIMEAQFDYLVFCDDDNWLFPDFLITAYYLLEKDASVGLIGAKGVPVFEGDEMPWFKECYEYYALGSQSKSWIIYGAGAVCRADVLKRLFENGFESLLTDRKGNALSSGGDLELSIAISLMGYKVFGSDELVFYHFMPASRVTKKYFNKMLWGTSKSLTCLVPYIYKYYKVFRKPYQRSWIWIFFINVFQNIRHDYFTKNIFNWNFPYRILRIKSIGYLLGLYLNRKIISEGFQNLDHAAWIDEKFKF